MKTIYYLFANKTENYKKYLPGYARVFANISPIILVFLFVLIYGKDRLEELGKINYYIAIITILSIIIYWGMLEYSQYAIASSQNQKKTMSKLVYTLVCTSIFFSTIFLVAQQFMLKNDHIILLFFINVVSINVPLTLMWNATSHKEKTTRYFILNGILLISIALFLSSIKTLPLDQAFLIARLISWTIILFLNIYSLFSLNYIDFTPEKKYKIDYKFMTISFLLSISFIILTQWDSIFISQKIGHYENGIYKTLSYLALIPTLLYVTFQTKAIPEYSKYIKNSKVSQLIQLTKKNTRTISLYSTLLLLIYIIITYFATILINSDNNQVSIYLIVLLTGYCILLVSLPKYVHLYVKGSYKSLLILEVFSITVYLFTSLATSFKSVLLLGVLFLITNIIRYAILHIIYRSNTK